MAAEAAANPIPSADLRSILFIAFLPRLRNEPPQKRRAHFRGEWWSETEKRVGLLRERACRWHQCWSFAPNGDFGTSRFQGNYILRDLTRLRKVVPVEDPLGIPSGGDDCGSQECPELAPLRHAEPYDECRLSGVKRKQRGHRETVAFDPSQTSGGRTKCLRRRHTSAEYWRPSLSATIG